MDPSFTPHESDFLGTKSVPAAAYWGVHTARALENFPISGQPLSCMPELVRALAFVKKAAAQANAVLGVVDAERARFIATACDDLIAGRLHHDFVADVIQGGAGTSTNMNANGVIAADHARPGIPRLRGDDRGGRGAAERGARAAHRGEPGRDRHRHRHQRTGRLRRGGRAAHALGVMTRSEMLALLVPHRLTEPIRLTARSTEA